MLDESQAAALIAGAAKVRESAYAPYSRYKVGAAVVAEDDRVFFGCNVENTSYGLALCAERSAMAAAVGAGVNRIRAVVVVTGADPPAPPCGACLQWMAEFADDDLEIIAANPAGCRRRFALRDLLAHPFRA